MKKLLRHNRLLFSVIGLVLILSFSASSATASAGIAKAGEGPGAAAAADVANEEASPDSAGPGNPESPSSGTAGGRVSLNVVNADVRDVLSALFLNMGKSIVFKGTPSDITLKVENVTITEALELITRVAGLIYVDDGSIIIVGDRDAISSDFPDSVEIAEFNLKFITAGTLTEQITALGLRAEPLNIQANSKTLWVQGFPSDLAKIRQIITMLDKNENVELGSAEIASCFRAINVEYISAEEFQSILAQLSLPSGFTLGSNPGTLYVYASNEDFESINSVKSIVDVVENYSPEGSYFKDRKIELYKLSYTTTESIVSLFEEFSEETGATMDVSIVYTNGLKKSVWLCGSVDAINEAKDLIKAVDVPEMNALSRIQVFRLYKVTASEMEKKLSMLAIPEITVYTFPYPEFSKSILVSCPADYMNTVSELIGTLDQESPAVTLPVDSSDAPDGSSRLYNRRILISELSGIPVSKFKISINISKEADKYRYVMYLTASPEEIRRVKDIIAEIDGV